MYCTVCGYGGEKRPSCPRCGASGASLIDIPALAQGSMYPTNKVDIQRDELGFTNPNLHRRVNRFKADVKPSIPEPTPEETSPDDYIFELNEDGTEYSVVVYGGTSQIPKIPNMVDGIPVTKVRSEAFSCSDTYFVYVPEGVLGIE